MLTRILPVAASAAVVLLVSVLFVRLGASTSPATRPNSLGISTLDRAPDDRDKGDFAPGTSRPIHPGHPEVDVGSLRFSRVAPNEIYIARRGDGVCLLVLGIAYGWCRSASDIADDGVALFTGRSNDGGVWGIAVDGIRAARVGREQVEVVNNTFRVDVEVGHVAPMVEVLGPRGWTPVPFPEGPNFALLRREQTVQERDLATALTLGNAGFDPASLRLVDQPGSSAGVAIQRRTGEVCLFWIDVFRSVFIRNEDVTAATSCATPLDLIALGGLDIYSQTSHVALVHDRIEGARVGQRILRIRKNSLVAPLTDEPFEVLDPDNGWIVLDTTA